jgi:hypothetical protein
VATVDANVEAALAAGWQGVVHRETRAPIAALERIIAESE